MNAPWRIELFGGLQLLGENYTVSRFQTRKTGALLGYLAYHKEKPISREVLADLFWPENEPEAARNSLRVALNSLRRQLEPPGIPTGGVLTADRAFVWLSGQAVVTDTFEFDRALKAERLAGDGDEAAKINHLLQAVELYKGPLLLGWYEEWIDGEQNRLAEVYAGALRRLTGLLYKNREFDRALEFAQKAVLSDPLHEENHRHLMRLYAAMGRPDAAFGAFRELETVLREQMNAPPSPVTRDLVKQIAALPVSDASLLSQAGRNRTRPAAERFCHRAKPCKSRIRFGSPCCARRKHRNRRNKRNRGRNRRKCAAAMDALLGARCRTCHAAQRAAPAKSEPRCALQRSRGREAWAKPALP